MLNIFFADPTAAACLLAAGAKVYHIERDFSQGDIAGEVDEPLPLREAALSGETLRLWCGRRPEDICGLYMLCQCLTRWQLLHTEVSLVSLPFWDERPDGVVVIGRLWGELGLKKAAWQGYADRALRLPPKFMLGCGMLWQELQRENAPRRAMVDGHLLSVAEDFYEKFFKSL